MENPTLNQIIEAVNASLAAEPEKEHNLWSVRQTVSEQFGNFRFHVYDRNGTCIYAMRGDRKSGDLFSIKAKRKKIRTKGKYEHFSREVLSVVSLTLETVEMGNKTVQELSEIYASQSREDSIVLKSEKKARYLKVKAFIDRTGITIDELTDIYHDYDKIHYSWDKLEEEYKDIPKVEQVAHA